MPEGFKDSFVKLAQKARPARKRIQTRIATMSPLDRGQELRERQAANLRAEEMRKTATEQLIHASGRVPKKARTRLCDDEFLWSHSSARRRKSREKSLACSPGSAPRGHADNSWTKTGGETCCVQQHGTGSQIRNAQKPGACTFCWLATSHQVPFPSVEEHMLDYLELKVQEPCNRVALKVVHQSLVHLEEIAEISPSSPPHSPATLQQPPSRTLVPDQTRS